MRAYRFYALLGATGGAGVTAAFWFGIGAGGLLATGLVVAGAFVGALAGVLVGDGSIQRAWAGWVGAAIVPPIAIALACFVLMFVLSARSH